MQPWQQSILFMIMAAGAVFLLLSESFGLSVSPTALTGYGAISTYVLTQKPWQRKKAEATKEDEPAEAGHE